MNAADKISLALFLAGIVAMLFWIADPLSKIGGPGL